MAFLVYQTSKKTGTVYAYEAVSYRDPKTGRPKTRKTYLGRVDPISGRIIEKAAPGKRNRSKLGLQEQPSGEEADGSARDGKETLDRDSVGEGPKDIPITKETYLIEKQRKRIEELEAELKASHSREKSLERALEQIGAILQKCQAAES